MKYQRLRNWMCIPAALMLLALLYAGRPGASAQGLASDGWNGSFHSALSANGNVPDYGYPIDKKLTTFPHLAVTGYPLPILLATGQPPYLGPNKPSFAKPGVGNIPTPLSAVTLTAAFSPSTILVGGISTLTFTLTNPAGNPAVNGIKFNYTFPANENWAGGSEALSCVGEVTPFESDVQTYVSVGLGSLPAGPSSCTLSLTATSALPGVYTNDSSNISNSNIDASGVDATLTVLPTQMKAVTLTAAFNPSAIVVGGTSTLTLSLKN